MSDTPETDAATHDLSDYGSPVLCSWGDWVDADFARKLERERDEAREAAAKWESSSDAMERAGAEQARRADENREWALKAERERDEAHALLDTASDRIEQLNGLCNLLRDERDILRSNKMSDPLLETTFKHLNRERDEACQVQNGLAKQVEQLRKERDQLKEALEHAQMTIGSIVSPSDKATLELIKVTKERDEARAERDILRLDAQREAEQHDRMVGELEKVYAERDEARQRASELALGVKVADCMYDYGKYSVALREAKIKARYLQELTRAAYDEVEKLEDQEATK